MNTNASNPFDNAAQAWGATLLRVALGIMWITHALLKVLVYTLPGAAQFFSSVGLPGFMVYPVVAMELLGGTALLLGFYGRQASLLLA
ncbi:MAG: DoxX family membrane protein, partial [Polaromonas sp.]